MLFKKKNVKKSAPVLREYTETEFKSHVQESIEKGKNGDPMGMVNIAISYKYGKNGYEMDREKAKRILQAIIDIDANPMAVSIAQEEMKDL